MATVLHFLNGETVIGQIVNQESTTIILKNPLLIRASQTPKGVQIMMAPYSPFSKSEEFHFNKSSIISHYAADSSIHDSYENALKEIRSKLSGLILPPSNIIPLNENK